MSKDPEKAMLYGLARAWGEAAPKARKMAKSYIVGGDLAGENGFRLIVNDVFHGQKSLHSALNWPRVDIALALADIIRREPDNE